MSFLPYDDKTPAGVKNAEVSHTCLEIGRLTKAKQRLHLVTQNTPNGQKVQIFLEELVEVYGTAWTTTLMYVKQSP